MNNSMVLVKADLHNHLRTSSNLKQEDFNRAIDLAEKRLGKNSIFALANFSDNKYEQFTGLRGYERQYLGENKNAIYVPSKKVLVIKAQEIPTQQGHVSALGLHYNQQIQEHRSLEETLEEIDNATDGEAIKIASHPFFQYGIGDYLQKHPDLLEFLDAIEIHNGEAMFGNQEALAFYKELFKQSFPIGALSVSDGHSFHELGTNWTSIEFPETNPMNFLHSLKYSIRDTNHYTSKKTSTSYLGAAGHLMRIKTSAALNSLATRIFNEVFDIKGV